MALNRFDWMTAADAKPGSQGRLPALPDGAALRARAQLQDAAISIRPTRTRGSICSPSNSPRHDAPAGTVTLTFSGGGVIRLEVECLEAELADLGEVSAAGVCVRIISRRHGDGIEHSGCMPGRTAAGDRLLSRCAAVRTGAANSFISTAMTASVAA